jgi:hypothetical protein
MSESNSVANADYVRQESKIRPVFNGEETFE